MAKLGRKRREFPAHEVKRMVDLFNLGKTLSEIGQLQRPPCAAATAARVLRPVLGNLEQARSAVQFRLRIERLLATPAGRRAAAKAALLALQTDSPMAEGHFHFADDLRT